MLRPIPVQGKFGSLVEQTVNGKRLESKTVYPTAEEAVMEASGMNDPDYKFHAKPRVLSADEMAQLNRL